jgi:hypothetical protein
MGVDKTTLIHGNGTDVPEKGSKVTIEYEARIYDTSALDNKGDK